METMDFVFKRTYRGPLRGVILDWAGTTVDHGCRAPAVVFREMFARFGVEITMDQAREPMGTHKRTHILKITQMDAVRTKWEDVHGRPPTEQDVDNMFQEFLPRQLEVLSEYSDLIPGCLDAVKDFRDRGLKVGSTTGYLPELMTVVTNEALARGYEPDCMVCAGDVPAGRPEPWMCYRNAEILRVFPMEAMVKVGDTVADVLEGLNAGMWTIAVAVTGNEVGLSRAETEALTPAELAVKRERAYAKLASSGAHYVVDGIADVPAVLDEIGARVSGGERP